MMNQLTKETFANETKEGVCLVAVGAPWCPDCKKIEPIMGMLMQEYAGKVKFCMVMADEQEALKTRCHKHSRFKVKEIEQFFRSSWFGRLTDADPEYIMEKIRDEVDFP